MKKMNDDDFQELSPNPKKGLYNSEHVSAGIPIPKTQRVQLFSPDEWEEFTEEWASSLENSYHCVKRFAGAGDKGLDVVGFIKSNQFNDGWDNYQCKFYDKPLTPSNVWVEFGKIIYFTKFGSYTTPRKYYFVAPKQIGTRLGKLLSNASKLKKELKDNWEKYCQNSITSTAKIKLEGDLLTHLESFDFTIFDSVSLVQMIKQHVNTPFHTVRFGGGLGIRPEPEIPPENTVSMEQRYVRQLLNVYAQSIGNDQQSPDLSILDKDDNIRNNFLRQRERFYHAESLRSFSRDTLPLGVFEALQDDIFDGVVDTCEASHSCDMDRLNKTMSQAANVTADASPLSSVTRPRDKQGMCHQLVNDNRLNWSENDE
ncbi:ABC-three component system protein [Psychromonas aquatilis]|uniref:ABC-three component system protein n=1 Tax=Psychromonas aquatilis TaxID=2005072 RepID=A0ABU9GLN2_9GAMM